MPISVHWSTGVINVPKSYLTPLGGVFYELDVDQFRRDLKSLEAGETGICFPDTHAQRTSTVTLSGVVYDRIIEVLDNSTIHPDGVPYTVEFESGDYIINCTGANHNIADVITSAVSPSILVNNSAGRTVVSVPATVTAADIDAQLSGTHGSGSWETTDRYDVIQGWTDDPANGRVKYRAQLHKNGEFVDASGWTMSVVLYEDGLEVFNASGITPDAQGMFQGMISRAQYTPSAGSSFESEVTIDDGAGTVATGAISVSVLSQQ